MNIPADKKAMDELRLTIKGRKWLHVNRFPNREQRRTKVKPEIEPKYASKQGLRIQ